MKALAINKAYQEIPSGRSEIQFNPANRREVEEAKHLYQRARLQGRFIQIEGKDVDSFRPCAAGSFVIEAEGSRDTDQMALHIFDETGDRRIMWRPSNPTEVKEAAALFNEYIKKGWKAYAIHRLDPHARGTRVYEFDGDMDEVVFDDRTNAEKLAGFTDMIAQAAKKSMDVQKVTLKQKLKKFAESFDHVKLLPKTYPG
jgi:hypothetical protein